MYLNNSALFLLHLACRPWIENYFIEFVQSVNKTFWYPLIPLPAQWTDVAVVGSEGSRSNMQRMLNETLRDDMLYVSVSQHDVGHLVDGPSSVVAGCAPYRNILLLSSGGWGNVPLPLIKGQVSGSSSRTMRRKFLLSFKGREHFGRKTMVDTLRRLEKKLLPPHVLYINEALSDDWKTIANQSAFALSPRGFGRSAFRTFELLQSHVVPIYLFEKTPWLPFDDCTGPLPVWGLSGVALSSSYDDIPQLLCALCILMLPTDASAITSQSITEQYNAAMKNLTHCYCSKEKWAEVLRVDGDGFFQIPETSTLAKM
ncbi:MAG: hypothetical protein EOP06_14895, partial [Proteobacteria bacterium]